MTQHALAILALVFSTLGAAAQPQPQQCAPPDVVVAQIAETHPVDKMIVLDQKQAERVGVWFDGNEPPTEFKFNFAVVLKHTSGQLGLLLGNLLLGKDGTVCMAFIVPDAVVPALMAAIAGTHAEVPFILVQMEMPHHSPEDVDLHNRFYFNWMVPNHGNDRVSSCCSNVDCAPADTKLTNGHWYGRRRMDQDWIRIPDALIESNQSNPRESPDTNSHICVSSSGTVLCAVLGAGL